MTPRHHPIAQQKLIYNISLEGNCRSNTRHTTNRFQGDSILVERTFHIVRKSSHTLRPLVCWGNRNGKIYVALWSVFRLLKHVFDSLVLQHPIRATTPTDFGIPPLYLPLSPSFFKTTEQLSTQFPKRCFVIKSRRKLLTNLPLPNNAIQSLNCPIIENPTMHQVLLHTIVNQLEIVTLCIVRLCRVCSANLSNISSICACFPNFVDVFIATFNNQFE